MCLGRGQGGEMGWRQKIWILSVSRSRAEWRRVTHLSPYSNGLARHCVQASWNHWPQLPHCNIFRFHLQPDTKKHAGELSNTWMNLKKTTTCPSCRGTSLYLCIIKGRVKGWRLQLPVHIFCAVMCRQVWTPTGSYCSPRSGSWDFVSTTQHALKKPVWCLVLLFCFFFLKFGSYSDSV